MASLFDRVCLDSPVFLQYSALFFLPLPLPLLQTTGFKSYGIFLPLRSNLSRARFQLLIPKQTITSLSQIFLALLFRENVVRPARVADFAFNDFSMNLCNIFNSFLIGTSKEK